MTGPPGVGKTTTIQKVGTYFLSMGVKVGGFITSEAREHGHRIGFEIVDLSSNKRGWLARKDYAKGPRVGTYGVVTEDLEAIGVTSLQRAIENTTELILVDEVGPMEMTSLPFRKIMTQVFVSDKPTVATLRFGSQYPEVERVKATTFQMELTSANRDAIYSKLLEHITDWLPPHGGDKS